jgi:hypothetical protein
MSPRTILASLACLASGWMASWLLLHSAPSPPSRPPHPPTPPTSQVLALHERVDALADDVDALWDAQSLPFAGSEAQREVAAEPSEVHLDASMARTLEQLATMLEHEPLDATWASEAERQLESRLSEWGALLDSVDEVECRSTFCRVEVRYDGDLVDADTLAGSMEQLAPWPAHGVYSVETEGEHRAWVFMSREDHTLPAGAW